MPNWGPDKVNAVTIRQISGGSLNTHGQYHSTRLLSSKLPYTRIDSMSVIAVIVLWDQYQKLLPQVMGSITIIRKTYLETGGAAQ